MADYPNELTLVIRGACAPLNHFVIRAARLAANCWSLHHETQKTQKTPHHIPTPKQLDSPPMTRDIFLTTLIVAATVAAILTQYPLYH